MSPPAWGSKVTAGSRHVTPLRGRLAPRARSHSPLALEKWPGSSGRAEGTIIFEDLCTGLSGHRSNPKGVCPPAGRCLSGAHPGLPHPKVSALTSCYIWWPT